MRSQSATLAWVNTLPPEILSNILVRSGSYCTRDNVSRFCDPAAVCTYWREVALGTVDLWTHIDLGPGTSYPLANLLLGRSKDSPIHVHLYEPKPPNYDRTPDYEVSKAVGVLAPLVHRVSTLDIKSLSYSRNLVSAILNLWLDSGSASLPRLLGVSRPSGHKILSPDGVSRNGKLRSRSEHAESVLKSLTVLHLHGVLFDWDSDAYRGLHDLRLDFSGYSSLVSTFKLAKVLSASPMLTVLKLKGLQMTVEEEIQPAPVFLGSLKVLSLQSFHSTDGLRLFLPLITLPSSSTELSIGIHGSDGIYEQLQNIFTRSSIATLFWKTVTWRFLSLLNSVTGLQNLIIINLGVIDDIVTGYEDLLTSLSTPFSHPPRVILLLCPITFKSLRHLVARLGIRNLRLEQCFVADKIADPSWSLEDVRAALLQIYPGLECSISDTDSTAELSCRTMFD
ncbi:hypothetical protein FRC12_018648 [Ceratobasidium sp. 428]|nr:hypothetical protein FRC12_018648 [Ceratobasidium sp. 428]